MISSYWINTDKKHLFTVSYSPDKESKDLIILIAGLSSSMCDTDYFMSRLARKLYKTGRSVLQIDLFGMGDSNGDLENVSVNTIKSDIIDVFAYIHKFKFKSIIVVSRGIISTFVQDVVDKYFNNVRTIAINPYLAFTRCDFNSLNVNSVDYDNLSSLVSTEELDCFLMELGIKPSNLQGQKIDSEFLKSISSDEFFSLYRVKNHKVFSFNNERLFSRDATEQNNMIFNICEYIISI